MWRLTHSLEGNQFFSWYFLPFSLFSCPLLFLVDCNNDYSPIHLLLTSWFLPYILRDLLNLGSTTLNLIFIFSYYFLIYKNVLVLTQVLQLSNSSFIDITVCCIYWVVKSFPQSYLMNWFFSCRIVVFHFLNFLLPISHWLIPPIYVVEHAMVCQSYFPCRIKGFISPSYWDSCQLTPHSYQSTVWIASARCSI